MQCNVFRESNPTHRLEISSTKTRRLKTKQQIQALTRKHRPVNMKYQFPQVTNLVFRRDGDVPAAQRQADGQANCSAVFAQRQAHCSVVSVVVVQDDLRQGSTELSKLSTWWSQNSSAWRNSSPWCLMLDSCALRRHVVRWTTSAPLLCCVDCFSDACILPRARKIKTCKTP